MAGLLLETFPGFADGRWPHLRAAQSLTAERTDDLRSRLFPDDSPSFVPTDTGLVLFGSLARQECTRDSDVDWTLLIDGQADMSHAQAAYAIRRKINEAGLKDPGSTGMFGQMTFSHTLIHQVGGQDDTNHNLTRRILLLLESAQLTEEPHSSVGSVHHRVLHGIIHQYVEHDSGLRSDKPGLTRYLLNDVVRFWRTMCVDFAYKQREQGGQKWALRNIKLRLSRKLLYVKGLLMCFRCFGQNLNRSTVQEDLYALALLKPLDVLFALQEHFEVSDQNLTELLDAYDAFLGLLADDAKRSHLEQLPMMEVYQDRLFLEARKLSDLFQRSLNTIFFETPKLKELTLSYAVF